MDEIEWWEFDTPADMAEQVAGDIGFVIESAIEAHGSARIAVPGGKTPDVVYKALAARKDLDWSKITLVPTDDRLVALDDALSNYAKLESFFGAKGANVVPLVDEAALGDYREAGRLADERLKLIDWPLDLVMLGMGADGHTASIFPGPDLDRAVAGPRERRAVGVRPDPLPPEAPVERVTLTAAALSSARAVMIVVTGAEKRAVLEQAIEEGPLSSKPIGRVLAEIDAAVDIFWSAE
ncbi:6-phosphogluconolactonase [Sphingomonas sp. LY54]|uniref:6-phosphogluconolactonase n=1 Tax=Sphingomonas sp. LY54 TaxID=3095343 RepID=UPI002D797645|nr:6-phosphogluconolactonase [Sphingomonas sp. LY54]WRP28468.1 6-phosphogluconolactonase [Sphingomonas sp. LY54]